MNNKLCNVTENEVQNMIDAFLVPDEKVRSNQSKEDLEGLLVKNDNWKMASSYKTKEAAVDIIKFSLMYDSQRIKDWLNSPDSRHIVYLNYKMNQNVGYGLYRDASELTDMECMAIVVKKSFKKCEFSLLSSYPYVCKKRRLSAAQEAMKENEEVKK